MLPETLILYQRDAKIGCRLLPSSPQPTIKLSLAILAVIDHITLIAGVDENDPGSGRGQTRKPEQADRSGWSILIIEDDPFSLELYADLFEASGYTVVPALNGEEGLAAARREQPDIIICDIKLPKLGGCEVVRDLKTDPILRQIPIIAVTALDSAGDRDRLLAAGFDGYIPKPIVAETFTSQIVSFLSDIH